MAHPKSKKSKSKRDKRRTHKKLTEAQIGICKSTGEAHRWHRAYWHEGSMYYKGQVVIEAAEEVED